MEIFYSYGLFSARHPVLMICLSAIIILSCSYPLLNLPIPGSEPQQFFTLLENLDDRSHFGFPSWYSQENRTAFVQQFVVKISSVSWKSKPISKDKIIKVSLDTAFSIVNEVAKFSMENDLAVNKDCFHVAETVIKKKQSLKSMFPENGCLLISPASYWKNNEKLFMSDQNIQKTINQYESKTIKTPPSVKELLFGLSGKQSRLDLRNHAVSYAITLVLKQYNPKLIQSLEKKLHSLHSAPTLGPNHRICSIELEKRNKGICTNLSQVVTHIRYKPQMRFSDFLPLLSTYFLLGCYIYFSVRKINFVKSKVGMAFSAVVSVIASLMMAVGLCSLIGLTPTLNGGEMFPYLVCFVGLENILVITKSIVATHSHLDVDKRIAIGLSREGGSILKNLLLEMVLIGIGYVTSVPRITEFCAFAFVGILTDFFISMMFFVTVLSLDIRRLDVEDPYPESDNSDPKATYPSPRYSLKKRTWRKSSSGVDTHAVSIENGGKAQSILKIPKRLRVVFFFADTRMIQRGLMVSLVVWFSVLIYSDPAGIFDGYRNSPRKQSLQSHINLDAIASLKEMDDAMILKKSEVYWGVKDVLSSHYLSFRHWPTLFAYYNITLAEKFITVLPSILIPVSPNIHTMNQIFQEKVFETAKKAKVEPTAPTGIYSFHLPENYFMQPTGLHYYITLIIGAVSGILIVFLLNVMYHCICSRRYATPTAPPTDPGECIRIQLKGHSYNIDSVHVEGVTVTSSDISGQLRTWDTHSGDCTSVIKRENLSLPQENSVSRFHYNPSNQSSSSFISAVKSKPTVWSIVSSGQFVIVGCSSGQIEVWDSASCTLQCTCTNNSGGVVGLACEDRRIVAARITGRLDFYILEDFMEQQRTHKRTPSEILLHNPAGNIVTLHAFKTVKKAHQQPICAFDMCMRRVLTGSHDHTLKLYNFQDAQCLFTLLGHASPVTVLFMDKQAPARAVSGSTDGTIWHWDLVSGKGLHKMKKHTAPVACVQCSMHYIVSSAQDDRMCIWARATGYLLHVISLDSGSCHALSLLGRNYCVTGGKGFIFLWDVRNGELIRRFSLVHRSLVQPTVERICVSTDLCVVCVLGHELLVVRFPTVLEKD